MMQHRLPRDVSRWLIPVLKAVLVDITDMSRSSKPNRSGGAPDGRGSRKLGDNGSIVVVKNTLF